MGDVLGRDRWIAAQVRRWNKADAERAARADSNRRPTLDEILDGPLRPNPAA